MSNIMSIEAKIEKHGEGQVSLKVEVSAAEVQKSFNVGYVKVGKDAKVPGFRQGKVPKGILKKRYEFSIKQKALEDIVEKVLKLLRERDKIYFISAMEIEKMANVFNKLEEGEGISFEGSGEMYPEVKMCDYKGFMIEVPKYVYSQESITKHLEMLQERRGDVREKEDGLEVGGQDIVSLKVKFVKAGGAEEEADDGSEESSNYKLNMRLEDKYFDKLKGEIKGLKVGDRRSFKKEDVEDAFEGMEDEYVGLSLEVIKLEELILPELDDELAKDYNFENLSKLRQAIEDSLKLECKIKKEEKGFDEIMEKVIKGSEFSIGKNAVEYQIENYIKGFESNLKNYNMSLEDYIRDTNTTLEELKKGYEEKALKDTKLELIKSQIMEENSLEVGAEDIDLYCQEEGERTNVLPENIRSMLMQGTDGRNIVLHRKYIRQVLSNNELKEVGEELIS